MKNMKVLVALVLALALMMSVCSAFAASITINRDSSAEASATSGTVFTYYELLKADLSGLGSSDYDSTTGAPVSGAKVVYYVNDADLASALEDTGYFTATSVTGASPARWNMELVGSPDGATLAAALNVTAVTSHAIATDSFTMTGTSVTESGLEAGYYLITASNGSVIVAQTLADVTINEKNTYPGVDKKITGENGTAITATTENDVNIGDIVTYTVPVTIPANVAELPIVVTDTMYKGLTLDTTSLAAVNNDDPAETITGLSFSVATVDGDYNIYTVTIPATTVIANAGKTITLTYDATLNANAVINGDNPNTVKLTYDNYTTTDHTVTTKTHKIEVDKKDNEGNKLAGVKFTLTRDNAGTPEYYQTKSGDDSVWTTTLTEFETTTSANIVFDGIDAGTYTLTETYTPAGFNPLAAPITVVVAADGSVTYTSTDPHNTATNETATDAVITVINNGGTVLPSTGGIGTTIFYAAGLVMVLGAAVVLISRRKAEAED